MNFSFIGLLYNGGIIEYEDPDQPFADATRRDSLPGVIPHLTRSARHLGKLWTRHISVSVHDGDAFATRVFDAERIAYPEAIQRFTQ